MAYFAMLLLAVVAGCGSIEQAARGMQTSWLGKPADDFFVAHGPPIKTHTAQDGRRIYLWETTAFATGGRLDVKCSAELVADPAGSIIQIRPREDSIGLWNTSRCTEIFSR